MAASGRPFSSLGGRVRRSRAETALLVGGILFVSFGQYDVLAGQVWIAVPLTLLLAPLLFGWYLSS
jgi:hypothetical protein